MSGNFVHCKRERQRIVYIYSIHKVQCTKFIATFLGRLCSNRKFEKKLSAVGFLAGIERTTVRYR